MLVGVGVGVGVGTSAGVDLVVRACIHLVEDSVVECPGGGGGGGGSGDGRC